MLSLQKKIIKCVTWGDMSLLLHMLTLYFVDFRTLHVFWHHVVWQSWRLLALMQRLSNLHSSHTAAFHNPALAFPWLLNSAAARHCTRTSGAWERAWGSQGTRGAAKAFTKRDHYMGGATYGPEKPCELAVDQWAVVWGF